MRTEQKFFKKGKKLIPDVNKTKHTFDEQFKINMFDKNDNIAFQVRDDGFKSKIDKKDTNNGTIVGVLNLKIEELCRASGNKLWYRLEFPENI